MLTDICVIRWNLNAKTKPVTWNSLCVIRNFVLSEFVLNKFSVYCVCMYKLLDFKGEEEQEVWVRTSFFFFTSPAEQGVFLSPWWGMFPWVG